MYFNFRSILSISLLVVIGCSQGSQDENADIRESETNNKTTIPDSATRDLAHANNATRKESPQLENASAPSTSSEDAVSAESGSADWQHWRGPNHNGVSSETGLIRQFSDDGPKILWRQKLGTGYSGLTIAGERLFTLYGSEGRERIVCFNAMTGKQEWIIESDADFEQGRSFGPRSTPCVDGGLLYVAGASGQIYCLDAASSKTVWSFEIHEKYGMTLHEEGLSCSPLIDKEKLILAAGNSVFALNKMNGELIWRALEEKMNHSTPTIADLGGRRQLIALSQSNLVGLDPDSGKELWRQPQRGANCASPVIGPNNQIFTAAAYGFGCQLTRVDDTTATQVYKNNSLATHHATALLHDGFLYGFHDRPGLFKSVEFATGKEMWVSRSPGKGKAIIADNQLIIVTEEGSLVLADLNHEQYAERAKAKVVSGTCFTAPTLANGKLYIRSDKEMVCIDMKR